MAKLWHEILTDEDEEAAYKELDENSECYGVCCDLIRAYKAQNQALVRIAKLEKQVVSLGGVVEP